MKAIIPVAGHGKRLRPHTHTQPKVLVTVAGAGHVAGSPGPGVARPARPLLSHRFRL